MILAIAKWGRNLVGCGDKDKDSDDKSVCPFAADHPKLQAFMGASIADRKELRLFLGDIDSKVVQVSNGVAEMKGKLDLLLRGARVRWNGSMPDDSSGK